MSWSGQQDSNLHQPIDFTTGDSDKPGRNRGESRVKPGCDSDSAPMRAMTEAPQDGREIIAIWRDIAGHETPVFVFYCPSNRRFIGRHGTLHAGAGYIGWHASPRLIFQTRDGRALPESARVTA